MKQFDVCVLTSVHNYDDVRIYHKEALSLTKNGYALCIIAPNQSNDKLITDGITVITYKKSRNRLLRMLFSIWQVYLIAKRINTGIYHFHDPELIPVGILLKIKKKQVVYDVHEDVPKQILAKEWIWEPIRKYVAKVVNTIELKAAKKFDAIIAATPDIAKKFNAQSINVVTIKNYPIITKTNFKRIEFNSESNNIAYIGSIAKNRGIKEMIEAILIVNKTHKATLIIAGKFDSVDVENNFAKMEGVKNVDHVGWLNRDGVANLLSRVKVGLVLLHPEPRYKVSLPVKLFEYMSAGIPVIASDFPCWKEIIEENQCGLTVNPMDPIAIADAIKYIFDHPNEAEIMGQRGRKAVEQKYNWQSEEKKLLELYAKLL